MNTKYWLDSQTIKGVLVATIPFVVLVLKSFGVEITSEESNQFIDLIVNLAAAATGLYGFVMVISGRFKADKPLGFNRYGK